MCPALLGLCTSPWLSPSTQAPDPCLPACLPSCLPACLLGPAGTISHLSTSFKLMGRSADWDAFGLAWPSRSNPASALLLTRYKRGYAKDMKELGYEPCSAYPLAESTYRQLLDTLHDLATSQQDPVAAAIAWRDGCSIANLWDTALRGHDSGILRVAGIKGVDGKPVLPFTAPPAAGEYLVYPWSTKPNQVDPCLPIRVQHSRWVAVPRVRPFLCSPFSVAMGCSPTHCSSFCSDLAQQRYGFIYWLWQLQRASQALGQPLTDFLFRPTDGPVFAERPMTSAAIHDRFITNLTRAGLYQGGPSWQCLPLSPSHLCSLAPPPCTCLTPHSATSPLLISAIRPSPLPAGQTPHGVRRGTMQNDAKAGMEFSAIQDRAQIKTDRIVRLYLDPAAHLRGGKGQKRLLEEDSGSDAEGSS